MSNRESDGAESSAGLARVVAIIGVVLWFWAYVAVLVFSTAAAVAVAVVRGVIRRD